MAPPPVPTPQQQAPMKTKAGRIMKPTAKKRANGEMDGDSTEDELASRHQQQANGEPKAKKIRLLQTPVTPGPKTPAIKFMNQGSHRGGRVPYRPDGDGYDSEAEDREVDPVIEEQFILRMMPGEHCDYLRRCIEERKVGLPKSQGGADVAMRWADNEMRRCVVTVQGTNYAGVLVDLPTITEGMKTWDKKSFVKSADICQMLLVFAKVADEQEARTVALPKAVEHGYRWPHGLTPPMHDCIHRRFRKRLSKLEIQNKEAEVERLLRADKEAISTKYEFVDERQQNGDEEMYYEDEEEEEEEEDGEADAEGEQEEDYFGDADVTQQVEADEGEMDVDDLEAMFEEDEPGAVEEGVTPAAEAATPMTANGATPAAQPEAEDEGDSEEESEEGEGEEYGYMEEGEEDEDGEHDQKASVRNEIASLEKQKAGYQEQLRQSTSVIMRKRLEQNIRNTDAEIQLKKRSIGEVEDED
jgi:transcription initiation factor TFIID subunit 7